MPGIALFGATGRMGRAILPLIGASDDLRAHGRPGVARESRDRRDAGEVAGLAPFGAVVTRRSR